MGIGDPGDYPTGPRGGVLSCGVTPMDDAMEAACAWADSSTAGVSVVPDSRDVETLAVTMRKLRGAVEH